MEYIVKELTVSLLHKRGFVETLSRLREVGELDINRQIEILKKINSQDAHIFVAISGEDIIGTATILIEQKFIRQGAKVGHIEDVSVSENFKSKNIGSEIVKECINYAKRRGCYKIILDCSDEVVSFYEKLGFRKSDNHMRLDMT